MANLTNNNYLIRNSSGEFYSFFISKDNKLLYTQYDKSGCKLDTKSVFGEYVTDFSIDLDNHDKIHVLCLMKDGRLIYFIYNDNKWINHVLTKFDVRSNRYNHLSLKVVKNNIHIFYSTSNLLNPNVWTICHISGIKNRWDKQSIISITPGKEMSPFYVDFDSLGNIHLIYKDYYKGKQHIYYNSFSTFLNRWSKSPKRISNMDADNLHPSLLVDNRNNVHVAWSSLVDSSFKLCYNQLPAIGNNTQWYSYSLPVAYGNNTNAILCQDSGLIKMFYNGNNLLKSLVSRDFGLNWSVDSSLIDSPFDEIKRIIYSSNFSKEIHRYTFNHIYGRINDSIILFGLKSTYASYSQPNDHNELKDNEGSLKEDCTQTIEPSNYEEDNEEKPDNNLIESSDDNVKDFINKTKSDLNSILSETQNIRIIKQKIEQMINDNTSIFEQKSFDNREYIKKADEILKDLEESIQKCKLENESLYQSLDTIKKKYQENTNDITELENCILEIRKAIESLPSQSFFSKLLNLFK